MQHNDFRTRHQGGETTSPGAVASSWKFATLGRLELLADGDHVHPVATQRRKLAVLAYLALARRPVDRGVLVEMFWGDEDEDRARHSLSNALSYLRSIFGPAAIAVRRSEVALATETPLVVDAVELLTASKASDHARVLELYDGSFFDGAYVVRSDSFEEWVLRERAEIDSAFVKSCDTECMAAARNSEWQRCEDVSRRWLAVSPTSTEAALHLLNSLRAVRTPEGRRAALGEFDKLHARLQREYETEPDPRVVQLRDRIAARVEADHVAMTASIEAPVPEAEAQPAAAVANSEDAGAHRLTTQPDTPTNPPSDPPEIRAAAPLRSRHFSALRISALAAGVAAVLVAGAWLIQHRGVNTSAAKRPLIVVTDVASVQGDTSSLWLEDGLSQMISADLNRNSDVEVIAPTRVRDTRLRAQQPLRGRLAPQVALDIARRLGATLLVRGGFTHGAGVYVFDVVVRNTADGRALRSFTVTGVNPITIADAASARILELTAATAQRPSFAEVETSNINAYQHFIRALQAQSEGRDADSQRELDAAIALDSGFASALTMRAESARLQGDARTLASLQAAMRSARFTPRDLLSEAIDSSMHNGENSRAEKLAQQLVAQYPHDPRSYSVLAGLYQNRGAWPEYEATVHRQLALDSLANQAGVGPCVPCSAYAALVDGRAARGDLDGAVSAARRWISLQPDLPGAWQSLAIPLAYQGRFDAALDADRRAEMLSGNDPKYALRIARDLMLARRLGAADSLAHSWHGADEATSDAALDIEVLVMRERGQYSASIRASESVPPAHDPGALLLQEIDAFGRLGDYAAAQKLWTERVGNSEAARVAASSLRGDAARWFAWSRAIEANSIAGGADSAQLAAIADSMRTISVRSYYGRDWGLYHHVLGLVAMRGHRYADAEREFQSARWGVAGWTATVAWLARAQLAQGHVTAAIATLRQAYQGPLDAMGRYEPRSDLDFMMAQSFARAGVRDSARIYSGYVRRAWKNADPEIKKLLETLPVGT